MKFDNTTIISANQSSYTSLISEALPQIDFSVQLENYNHAFNLDNPTSVINYLESGQPVKVEYGYKTPGADEIEWIPGGVFECAEWEANDTSATIKCQDTLRNLAGDYYKGKVSDVTRRATLYSMANEVLQFAGVDEYYIDDSLKNVSSYLPVPRVSCREALQIIANAACSMIEYDRKPCRKIRLRMAVAGSTANSAAGDQTVYINSYTSKCFLPNAFRFETDTAKGAFAVAEVEITEDMVRVQTNKSNIASNFNVSNSMTGGAIWAASGITFNIFKDTEGHGAIKALSFPTNGKTIGAGTQIEILGVAK